jgi:glycosyltransferase involved in cell wall biosynthesis
VIAFAGGGALETVVDSVTGVFFDEQKPESLISSLQRFDKCVFEPALIRKHAERFDEEIFKKKIDAYIKEKYQEFISNYEP